MLLILLEVWLWCQKAASELSAHGRHRYRVNTFLFFMSGTMPHWCGRIWWNWHSPWTPIGPFSVKEGWDEHAGKPIESMWMLCAKWPGDRRQLTQKEHSTCLKTALTTYYMIENSREDRMLWPKVRYSKTRLCVQLSNREPAWYRLSLTWPLSLPEY